MSPEVQDQEHQPKNKLDSSINHLGNAASLLFVVTVAITSFEIVMRYVFNSPTIWVHESASFIGGALFVLGGSYALATNRHVRVVLLYDAVSNRVRQYLNIFHHIMGMLFSGLMIYASFNMTREAWVSPWGGFKLETSGSAWDPAFPAYTKAFILIIFIVMFLQFLLHFIQDVLSLWRRK